jgi:hypothetical protein
VNDQAGCGTKLVAGWVKYMEVGTTLGVEPVEQCSGVQADGYRFTTGEVEPADPALGVCGSEAVDTVPDAFHCSAIQQHVEVTPVRHGKDLSCRRHAVLVVEESCEFCMHEVMVSNPAVGGKSALWMTTVREMYGPHGVLADRHARSAVGV